MTINKKLRAKKEARGRHKAPSSVQDRDAYCRVLRARTALVMEQPFFASLALRLTVKEDPACRTAWTDGKVFAYNPGYVKCLSKEKLLGLCTHTVMHPACGHHIRRNGRDPDMWNRACDFAINPILLDAGFTLPDGFLYDERFRDKTADAVYGIMALEAVENQKEEEGESDLHEVEPPPKDDEERSSEDTEESRTDTMTLPVDDSEDEDIDDDQQDDTSVMGDPGLSGEVRDGKEPSGSEDEETPETDWDDTLVRAALSAGGMGKLPRGIERLVEARMAPRVGWRELLSRFIQKSARSDYSWTNPNRRYLHQDLYFPSLGNHELSEMAVAVDTSGSIQKESLSRFAAELSAILEAFPAKLHLLYTDMGVNRYQVLEPWDLPLRFNARGGGGTDFRPAFEFLEKERITPACLIYLTDLECRLFPKRTPHYPVLWARIGKGGIDPPFGQMIDLDVD